MKLSAFLATGAVVGLISAAAAQTTPTTGAGAAPAGAASRAPGTDPNDPWLWGDQAVLRGLDKVTAETRDFIAPVGEDVQFFALTISVKRCGKRPPERTPEVIVGMEVRDRQTNGAGAQSEAERIFSGWMFGSSPALNPLEHPVYDVWVLDCVDSRVPEDVPVLTEEEPTDELLMSTPADTPLPGEVFD